MPRFFLRVASFCLAVALLFGGMLLLSAKEPFRTPLMLLTASEDYLYSAAQEDVLPHIDAVRDRDYCTALIVGDSMCAQVFGPFVGCNKAYLIDGSNGALTLAGFAALVDLFLQTHPHAADVYLVLTPETFARRVDSEQGYQYVAMPFSLSGTQDALTPDVQARLTGTFGPLMRPAAMALAEASPLVKKLLLACVRQAVPDEPAQPLPELNAQQLTHISDLCAQRGVSLHLLCPPLADTPDRARTLADLEQAFRAQGFYETFSLYFSNVYWYPAGDFEPDFIHFEFDGDMTMEDFAAIIARYQADTGLLQGLVTSYD